MVLVGGCLVFSDYPKVGNVPMTFEICHTPQESGVSDSPHPFSPKRKPHQVQPNCPS